jgi:hypothetical protein
VRDDRVCSDAPHPLFPSFVFSQALVVCCAGAALVVSLQGNASNGEVVELKELEYHPRRWLAGQVKNLHIYFLPICLMVALR